MRHTIIILACSLLLGCASTGPNTKVDSSPGIPYGYKEYCNRATETVECGTSNKYTINEKNMTLATLMEVNKKVNNTVRRKTDKELYNVEEYWTPAEYAGDCEDYVLKKMHVLIQDYGWSPETLHITSAWYGKNNLHIVLVAELNDKLYVLDDSSDWVYELIEEKYYIWSATQLFGNSSTWISAKKLIDTFYPGKYSVVKVN